MTAAEGPDGPVTDAELSALFRPLDGLPALGLAVSGGPDSTALLLLARRWACAPGRPALHVLTVDHGLRASAASEAAAVVALAERLGLRGESLVWRHDGGMPVADIQAAARTARYRLLAEAAIRAGLSAVLLAHTLDDVAETLLMRLARGSGVKGLAAMPQERLAHGMRFLRPLLGVPKARLIATVAAAGIATVDDPSNASDRFLRARIRRLMPALAEVGLTPARLAGTAHRLARAADAIDRLVDALSVEAVTDHAGAFAVDLERLRAAPDEAVLRLLAGLVRTVRPAAYGPRAAPLEDWLDGFRRDGKAPRRTLAGVVLDQRRDRLWLYAEAGRSGFPDLAIEAPGDYLWDGRLLARVRGAVPTGARIVAGSARDDLPRAVAASLPRLDGGGSATLQCRAIAATDDPEATDN